jgi:AmiR/NasT family two-component response regulator
LSETNVRPAGTRDEGKTPPAGEDSEDLDVSAALERRVVIGQAQGILMERLGLTPQRAHAYLSRASQQANVKLHQVATELVATRRLPEA